MIQKEFIALVKKYTDDQQLADSLWNEIEIAYTDSERYFHNLTHLEQMLTALLPIHSQIEDWDSLLFAVFYHDVVYDVLRYVTENDNEDKSAEWAEKALTSIGYPAEKTHRVKQLILATKKHELSGDADTNFLTDADLSILGQPWEVYELYRKNIHKEYVVFPSGIYQAGRMKVLKNFLQMNPLFKTPHFQQQYEAVAKENIRREIEIVSI